MKQQGIYSITNNINNHKYIGSSINLKRRFREHYKQLVDKKHINKKLQNACSKYGIGNFSFEIIEVLPDFLSRDQVLSIEQFFLLSSDFKNMYNICKTVTNDWTGLKHKDSSKNKMSNHKRMLSEKSNKGIRLRQTKAGTQYYEVNLKRKTQSIYLGRYNTYEEALKARLEGEKKYWDENNEYFPISKEEKATIVSEIFKNKTHTRKNGSGITLKSTGTYQVQFYIEKKKCYFSGFKTYEEALTLRLDLEAKYWIDKPA